MTVNIYPPSSHKFAIACGAGGTFVEVTASVLFQEGNIVRNWGRTDAFSDAQPSSFSFTLQNADGKFTPGYATGIAPVVLPLAKGMGVSWELNGQIRSGRIRSVVPIFPPEGKPDAARVRVTVDDVLAIAARTTASSPAQALVRGATPYLFWALDDAATATGAVESSSNGGPRLDPITAGVTFGAPGIPVVDRTQMSIDVPRNSGLNLKRGARALGDFPTIVYPSASLGSWGCWVTVGVAGVLATDTAEFGIGRLNAPGFVVAASAFGFWELNGTVSSVPVVAGTPTYISVSQDAVLAGSWTVTTTLSVNGLVAVSVSSVQATLTNADKQVTTVELQSQSLGGIDYITRFSNVSHTPVPLDEFGLLQSTSGQRLTQIAGMVPSLILDTLPTDLTSVPLGTQSGGSVLDLFNEVIRGEQGHIYSVTSGTLLAPVEKVQVRGRTRPATVTQTFTTTDDVLGAPEMGYETTNTVSAVTANGSDASFTSVSKPLEAVVGTANTSIGSALLNVVDLRSLAEDRLVRGISSGVDVFSIVVNARSTTVSRWADMLAMTPGLRYRITGLPTAQLGFSQWDGWFLGATELHDQENNLFTLHFERTLPATGVFDTDRFMSGGETSLSAGINAAVTSMSVATTGARMSTTDLPYKVQIDNEIVNVTAASGATPQVLTIQRAQNGTTAATHSSGALVESYPDTLFAY